MMEATTRSHFGLTEAEREAQRIVRVGDAQLWDLSETCLPSRICFERHLKRYKSNLHKNLAHSLSL